MYVYVCVCVCVCVTGYDAMGAEGGGGSGCLEIICWNNACHSPKEMSSTCIVLGFASL